MMVFGVHAADHDSEQDQLTEKQSQGLQLHDTDTAMEYKKRPETEKQWFKIFEVLKENDEMTISNISKVLDIPEPSIRRILSQFKAIGRIETIKKPCTYKLK